MKRINSGDRTLDVSRVKTKPLGIRDKYYTELKNHLTLAKDFFKMIVGPGGIGELFNIKK